MWGEIRMTLGCVPVSVGWPFLGVGFRTKEYEIVCGSTGAHRRTMKT